MLLSRLWLWKLRFAYKVRTTRWIRKLKQLVCNHHKHGRYDDFGYGSGYRSCRGCRKKMEKVY